jgi:hypothetical protein
MSSILRDRAVFTSPTTTFVALPNRRTAGTVAVLAGVVTILCW